MYKCKYCVGRSACDDDCGTSWSLAAYELTNILNINVIMEKALQVIIIW